MPKEYYHDIDLNANQLYNSRLHNITTAARIILGGTLTASHKGFQVYDTDLLVPYYWDGIAWQTAVNGAIWGNITGLITNQTDLITYLSGNYYPLSSNPAGYLTSLTAAGLYVPLNRNITINGITFDLSADRTWTISSLPPQAGNSGNYLTTDGINASWAPIPLPTPAALTKTDDTNVTLTLTGSPNTSLLQAVGLQLGWTGTLADSRIASAATWNAKQDAISLTTTGTSGPATFTSNVLNVPQYQSVITNPVTGTGTATRVAFWDSSSSISSDADLYWDNINKRFGIGNTAPQTRLHIGNIGGGMGFPYEEAIVERFGDTKFGVYTSTNGFGAGGASYVVGATNLLTNAGYYPGFEWQFSPDFNDNDNFVRYNFLQRDSSGIVAFANPDIFNIYADSRISFKKLIGVGTEMVVADSSGFISRQAIPTFTSPLTTKGDIYTYSTIDDRLPVGTNGQILAADSTATTGLKWIPNVANSLINTVASGTDTYTATVPGITSYTDGETILVRFTNGNTTTCTLNINGLGAVPLYRNNDGPLIGGDIQAGAEMLCVYNASVPSFQCIGISPNTLIAYVTNDDSVTLTKGMAVYAFSGTGDRMTVKRANNTADATSAQTVGLVLSTSIAANQKGFIMMQGLLDGLSILPTATWSDGDPVYLGSTPGSITKVKPYAPNHLVYLGVVTTASNGAAGRMYVRVQNGYELDELHNVQAQSPSLKDTLWYDSAVSPGQWKTASIPTVLGYTPPNTYYQNTAPIGTIVLGSFWMNSDTGLLYQYIDDGTSTQWVQESLPLGPVGPTGPAGPNNITSSTVTNLVGILKGDGLTVSVATGGVDYQTVTNLSTDGTFAANSDTLYPSQKATKTYVDAIVDDLDYTLIQSFKSFYNY